MCGAAAADKENGKYDLLSTQALDDGDEEWLAHMELTRGLAEGKIKLPAPTKIFGYWADQGIMWLNRTLTYTKWDEAHRLSHTALWKPFTRRAIEVMVAGARGDHPVVFALWGGPAKALEPEIEGLRQKAKAPKTGVRYVRTGHPQIPKNYFEPGNHLEMINEEFDKSTPKIKWV